MEQARSALRCHRSEPLVKPITALQTQLASTKADLTTTRRALSAERTAHSQDVTALELQLREHHEQAEDDLGLLRKQLAAREGQVRRESRLSKSQPPSEGLGISTSSSPGRGIAHLSAVPRSSTPPGFGMSARERAVSPNPHVADSGNSSSLPGRRSSTPDGSGRRPNHQMAADTSNSSTLPGRRSSTPDGSGRRPSVLDTSAQIDGLVGLHGQQLQGLRQQIAQERQAHEVEVAGLKAKLNSLQVGGESRRGLSVSGGKCPFPAGGSKRAWCWNGCWPRRALTGIGVCLADDARADHGQAPC